jgi:drug/metabolite transporter (DMT)-like permease
VFTVFLAALVLGEPLPLPRAGDAALVLAGVYGIAAG